MSSACDCLRSRALYQCSTLRLGPANPVFIKGECKKETIGNKSKPLMTAQCACVCAYLRAKGLRGDCTCIL